MALVMALILPFRHRCRDYLVIYLSRSRGLIDRAHVEKKGIKNKKKKRKRGMSTRHQLRYRVFADVADYYNKQRRGLHEACSRLGTTGDRDGR
jgi:hypothetical protein